MLIFLPDVDKTKLDQELLVKLDQTSALAEFDLVITSGFRPGVDGVDHGIKNGPHMTGKAADIRCNDSISRYKLINAAFKAGFLRIGIGSADQPHVHLDVCPAPSPQVVLWLE